MSFEEKPNQANCFAKEGFTGYSGSITLEDGSSWWITVYDNEGKKGPYRAVKLKPKQKNAESSDDSQSVPF